MAESLNQRAALKDAWAHYWSDQDDHPPINHYFECGFDAAWDALLSEIRPLVAELQSYEALERQYYSPGSLLCRKHSVAVDRLRELVREAGE